MASVTRMVVDYTDDMTGRPITEEEVDKNFSFSVDGIDFKLDTHSSTANEIRELLARAAANSEIDYYKPQAPAPKPKKRTNPERSRLLKKIRFWASENGWECPDRGRIPEKVVVAYRQANPGVDMSAYDKEQ
ncbi:Lsr2 dimerization domain-containing protein [Streptomyces rimosus]|uniref:Lsr2 dimerization domain-containing protein n=1 Tax=Streptomyces rimosus TaxID=1927 RepID=UPI0004C19C8A|nr:histone-like nucleoid-structuring protein Lsr2 [Streptomyces rimosus]